MGGAGNVMSDFGSRNHFRGRLGLLVAIVLFGTPALVVLDYVVFVAGDQEGVAPDRLEQGFALGGLAGLLRFDFEDFDGAETERTALRGGALGPVAHELGFRGAAEPTYGRDDDPHRLT